MNIVKSKIMNMYDIDEEYKNYIIDSSRSILFTNISNEIIDIINNCKNLVYILWRKNMNIDKYISNMNKRENIINIVLNEEVKNFFISKHLSFEYLNSFDGYLMNSYYNFNIINKNKIALLISGYTRTFDITYKNLLKFINGNNQYIFDLYVLVHTGRTEMGGKYKEKKNNYIKNIQILKKNFNIKMLIIKENYSENEIKINYKFFGQFYFLSELYKYFLDYTNDNNISYDLIMRTRYDINLSPYKIKNIKYYENKIIVPKGYFHGFNKNLTSRVVPNYKRSIREVKNFVDNNIIINDKMAIGSINLMKIYLTHGRRVISISKYLRESYNIGSTEGYLAYDLKTNNINFTFDNNLGCSIIRRN